MTILKQICKVGNKIYNITNIFNKYQGGYTIYNLTNIFLLLYPCDKGKFIISNKAILDCG